MGTPELISHADMVKSAFSKREKLNTWEKNFIKEMMEHVGGNCNGNHFYNLTSKHQIFKIEEIYNKYYRLAEANT